MWKPLWEIWPLINRLWTCKVVRVSTECHPVTLVSAGEETASRSLSEWKLTQMTSEKSWSCRYTRPLSMWSNAETRANSIHSTGALAQAGCGFWNLSDCVVGNHKQLKSQGLQVKKQREHKVPSLILNFPFFFFSFGLSHLCWIEKATMAIQWCPLFWNLSTFAHSENLMTLLLICTEEELNFALWYTSKTAC